MQHLDPQFAIIDRPPLAVLGRGQRRLGSCALGVGTEGEQVGHGLDHGFRNLVVEQLRHRRPQQAHRDILQGACLQAGTDGQQAGGAHPANPRKARRPGSAAGGGTATGAANSACSAASAVSRACSWLAKSSAGENSEHR